MTHRRSYLAWWQGADSTQEPPALSGPKEGQGTHAQMQRLLLAISRGNSSRIAWHGCGLRTGAGVGGIRSAFNGPTAAGGLSVQQLLGLLLSHLPPRWGVYMGEARGPTIPSRQPTAAQAAQEGSSSRCTWQELLHVWASQAAGVMETGMLTQRCTGADMAVTCSGFV